jgi:hypothetical protein
VSRQVFFADAKSPLAVDPESGEAAGVDVAGVDVAGAAGEAALSVLEAALALEASLSALKLAVSAPVLP